MFGTAEQKERWLRPLLDGEIRSAFGMTEPDVASSDATNISTRIERDGDSYVINGRKWWTTGIADPRCRVMIVMGKTDPSADTHRQQSMILVPVDTPGVEVVRSLPVFGYHDQHGHGEVSSPTSGCRRRTCSARRAAVSPSPRPGSVRAASTTACAPSAWPSGR